MRSSVRSLAAAAMTLAIATPSLLHAQAPGLEDMVNARAGQAEAELQRRGYRNMGGEKGGDRSYAYWWNADRRQCVSIATRNGRYVSITPTTAPDCRQSANADRGRSPYYRDDRRYPDDRRYSDDRRYPDGRRYSSDRRRGLGAYPDELSRRCKAEAAQSFDRRPGDITANAPIKQRNGYVVQGWFDRRSGSKFFNCRFDEDGRFLGVN